MLYNTFTLINQLAKKLSSVYSHTSEQQQTAWWLLQAITKKTEAALLAQQEIELTKEQENQLNTWIEQHVVQQKPLQYILGSVPFNSINILCEPPTLIPRPETEEYTIKFADKLQKLQLANPSIHPPLAGTQDERKAGALNILDLATGSGCIALALAKALPKAHIYATDISEQALALAKKNANFNNISNVTFLHSDIYKNIPTSLKFDIIISNPPYISAKEWKALDPSVREWEDKHALMAEHDGFAIIEEIIKHAPKYIRYNEALFLAGIPQVIIEIGYRQGNRAQELMLNALYTHIAIEKDLEGKDRLIVGRVPRAITTRLTPS